MNGSMPENIGKQKLEGRNTAEEVLYKFHFQSPLGWMLLEAHEKGLTGLWFEKNGPEQNGSDQNGPDQEHADAAMPEEISVIKQTKQWLTVYFSGQEPDFMPPLHVTGTPFQLSVWEILKKIPYGETTTYGEIAKEIAAQRGLPRMSAQAVGGAVGHNKISILIPCHRVVGAGGNLTGYAGGLDKKVKLLALEKADVERFCLPPERT